MTFAARPKTDSSRPYTVIVLPDMHVPDHDSAAVDAVLQYVRDTYCDELVQLGDFLDLDSVSGHNKDKPLLIEGARLQHELDAGNEMLDSIQDAVRHNNKRASMTLLKGNHEWRLDRYLEGHPVLHGALSIDEGLNLASRGIRFVECYPHGELYQVGDAYFFHGVFSTSNHAKRHVDHYGVNIFYGHCFDVSTEVMTQGGWKRRSALTGDEKVGTMNLATGLFEWNDINSIHDTNGFDTMIEFDNDDISLRVTPDHGLVSFSRDGLGAKSVKLTARAAYNQYSQFATAAIKQPPPPEEFTLTGEPSLAEMRLAAWICARASYGALDTFSLAFRSDETIAPDFEIACAEAGARFTKHTRTVGADCSYTVQVGTHSALRRFMPWNGRSTVPLSFSKLSSRKIRELLLTLTRIRGDELSKTRNNHAEIVTYNGESADNIQILATMAGLTSKATARSQGNNRTRYTIELVDRTISPINPEHSRVALSSVKEPVWCLNVNNGTLFVRRNGKVCLTQNTHDVTMASKSIHGKGTTLVGQSLGCLINYSPPYMIGRPDNWQQAFATFWFRPNGLFNYAVTRVFDGGFVAPNGVFYQGREANAVVREPTFVKRPARQHIHLSEHTVRLATSAVTELPDVKTVRPRQDNVRKEMTHVTAPREEESFARGVTSAGMPTDRDIPSFALPSDFPLGNVVSWIDNMVVIDPNSFTPTEDLYTAYINWCGLNGTYPADIRKFVEAMLPHGTRARPGTKRGFRGLRLR